MSRGYEDLSLPIMPTEVPETITDISLLKQLVIDGARSVVVSGAGRELPVDSKAANGYFDVLYLPVLRAHSSPAWPLRLLNSLRPSEEMELQKTPPQNKEHLLYQYRRSDGQTTSFREHMWLAMPPAVEEFDVITSRAILAWGVVEKIKYIVDKQKTQA